MPTTNPRVDAYIERAEPFAQPILRHLRTIVHEACPDVEEKIKWGMPHFDYKGMMCAMAAFKAHCTFGFWKPELVMGEAVRKGGMGSFGRIGSMKDLPSKTVLRGYVKKAMELNDAGVKPKRTARSAKPKLDPTVPDDLAAALAAKKNARAKATFEAFSPSHRREYIEWITEAKRAETRAKRLAQTLEWLAEGKPRNWKYM